jgi:glycosyltransferase involved in cell wall biosynthesis
MQIDRNIFLSIVTISFNQANYLGALLDSVCSQLADDIEFIVVDPGSTDGSRDMLSARQDCITHLVFEPDEGPADGLNRGFVRARGKIGIFINSDDLMMPGAVARLRKLWATHRDADIVLGGAWMVDVTGRPVRELQATRNVQLKDFLFDRAILVQQGMSFRLATFRATGGFNTSNRTCWDYELLCRMLADGAKVVSVPDRLGAFRITGENISGGVGGETFYLRLNEDKARLYHEFIGRPLSSGRVHAWGNRIIKLAVNAGQTLDLLADRIRPERIVRRWEADFAERKNWTE